MRRFSLSVEWGKVPDDSTSEREGSADALVERADPNRSDSHELDHRPIGFHRQDTT